MSNYKINDYRVIAHFDHKNGYLFTFTQDPLYAEVIKKYHETGKSTHCDICGHRIERNDTYLIVTDDGKILQLGKDCLSDLLFKITNHCQTEDEQVLLNENLTPDGFKQYCDNTRETLGFLAQIINYTKQYGYKNPISQTLLSEIKATEESTKIANTIIEFFKTYEPLNDFELNIKGLLSKLKTHTRYVNTLKYASVVYEKANETKKVAIDNNTTSVKVKNIKVFFRQNSPYCYNDTITGYLIEDDTNHLLLWETNKNIDNDFAKIIGSTINFKQKSSYTSKNGDAINKIKNVKFNY